MKLWTRIRGHYTNISRKQVQKWLNNCKEHGEEFPIFSNKRKLRAVLANQPMDQVQVDLVDLSSTPSFAGETTYRYVITFLEVFSRYLVLAPMLDKTAAESALLFKQTILQLGMPKRLQTDQGSEFKG